MQSSVHEAPPASSAAGPGLSAQQKVHAESRLVAKRLLNHMGIPKRAEAIVDAITMEGNEDGPHMPSPFYVTEALSGANLAIAALFQLIAEDRVSSVPPPSAIRLNSEHASNKTHAHFTHEFDGRRYHEAQAVLQSGASAAGRDPNLQFNTMFVGHWRTKDNRHCIFYPNILDTPQKIMAAVGFKPEEADPLIKLANSENPEDRVRFCKAFGDQIATWNGRELQDHLTKVRVGTIGLPLSKEEFEASPHGQIATKWDKPFFFTKLSSPEKPISSGVADLWPAIPFTRIADPSKSGILSGVRILELTRVVAGPVSGMTLGHFGPDILRVSNPGIQDQFLLSIPMNMNKRLVEIDARSPGGRNLMYQLLLQADIFCENNAFGVTDRLGLGVDDVMKLIAENRPERGIIIGRSNAYGFEGPHCGAPGYEHVAQSMSGLTMEQGLHAPCVPEPPAGVTVPTLVPVNILDCMTGHSMALGCLAALYRRSIEGGSWVVQGSLLQSAMFVQSLPRHDAQTVKKLWERYPPWPLEFDGATLKGTMNHYFKFMSDYIRDGTPTSHTDDMYYEFETTTPYGVPIRTLSSPIKFPATKQGPRFAPRPFGFDKDVKWLDNPDESDVIEVGTHKYRWVGRGGEKGKL